MFLTEKVTPSLTVSLLLGKALFVAQTRALAQLRLMKPAQLLVKPVILPQVVAKLAQLQQEAVTGGFEKQQLAAVNLLLEKLPLEGVTLVSTVMQETLVFPTVMQAAQGLVDHQ